jgi:hypothetical protein
MLPYERLSDDELLDLGAQLESQLPALKAEVARLKSLLESERPKLRKSALKLGINTTLTVGGVATTPFTMGLSLILAAGSGAMATWDGLDYARERAAVKELEERSEQVRDAADSTADALDAVHDEIGRRAL